MSSEEKRNPYKTMYFSLTPLFCLPEFANFSPSGRFACEKLMGKNAGAPSENQEQRRSDGKNRQSRIKSIVKTAVTRKEPTRVLHAGNAL